MDKLIGEKVKKKKKKLKLVKIVQMKSKKMEEMFKNTGIGKIFKDITDELNIEQTLENGGGIEDILKVKIWVI